MPHVLIFEDDEILRGLYKRKFKNEGFDVDAKPDATKVLEDVKEESPDIVIMDILLPKVDGFEAIRRIMGDDSTKKIPVLVASNLGDPTTIQKSLWLGAKDVIVKAHLTPGQLVQKTKAILGGAVPEHKINPELIKFLHIDEETQKKGKE